MKCPKCEVNEKRRCLGEVVPPQHVWSVLERMRCVDSTEEPSPRNEHTLKYCIYFEGKKMKKKKKHESPGTALS